MIKVPVIVRDTCLVDEKKLFFCSDERSIFSMKDIRTGTTIFAKKMPFISGESYQFDKISFDAVNRNIIFTPLLAEYVLFYNIDTKKIHSIKIINRYKERLSFCGGYIFKRYLFMFGVCYPVIARVNLDTNEIDYIEGWTPLLDGVDYYVGRHIIELDEHLFIPMRYGNIILELEPETLSWDLHTVGSKGYGFFGVCLSAYGMVCAPVDALNDIVIWDIKNKEYSYISIDARGSTKNESVDIWCDSDKIYVFGLSEVNSTDPRVIIVSNSSSLISCNINECRYYDKKENRIKNLSNGMIKEEYITDIDLAAFVSVEGMVLEGNQVAFSDYLKYIMQY